LRNKYYSEAKGFLFPQEEDFWIVPIEAMASGTPVIAYHKGWATETVIDEITWIFFENQSVRSFYNAIERFEKIEFHPEIIRNHALNFDTKFFQQKLLDFITSKIQ
jgi:glycosyltransferase involved in cell wall biosynthesis